MFPSRSGDGQVSFSEFVALFGKKVVNGQIRPYPKGKAQARRKPH